MSNSNTDISNNSKEFIKLYNKVDKWMREGYSNNSDKRDSFFLIVEKVAKKNASVRRHKNLLKSLGNLRNAILHDEYYPERIIANPTDSITEEFRIIVEDIIKPELASKKASKIMKIFSSTDSLQSALETMRDNDFSQIVIRKEDNRHTVITREGIARWLESNIIKDIFSINDTLLDDVLLIEDEKGVKYLDRNASLYEAAECFGGLALRYHTVLITHNGLPTEKPLGILTVWDVRHVPLSI